MGKTAMFRTIVLVLAFRCASAQYAVSSSDSSNSCFSSFNYDPTVFISSTKLPSIDSCLQYCYTNLLCQSVVWDRSACLCYQYRTTVKQNPAMLLNRMGSDYFERTCGSTRLLDQENQSSTRNFMPPSTKSLPRTTSSITCPVGSKFAYLLTANTAMIPDSVDKVTHYTEENKCIAACTDIDWCRSITLYPVNQTCIASHSTLPPTGTSKSIPNPDAVYLEKFCLPTAAPNVCTEQFFYLFHAKNLNGFSMSTNHRASMAECAGACTVTPGCKAGVYDSNTKVCVLKQESAVSSNGGLRDAASSVYYFENGCLIPSQRRRLLRRDYPVINNEMYSPKTKSGRRRKSDRIFADASMNPFPKYV